MTVAKLCCKRIAMAGLSLVVGVADLAAQPAASLKVLSTRELHADLTEESVPLREGSVILPLPSGDVLVGHANSGRILRFRANQATASQLGNTGRGPAEFQGVERMGLIADTVWIYDGRQERITYVRRFGEAAPVTRALVQAANPGVAVRGPIALTENGRFVAKAGVDHSANPSESLRSLALVSSPRVGTGRTDTLARLFLSNLTLRVTPRGGNGMMLLTQLLSDASKCEASANGRFIAIVDQQDGVIHDLKTVRLLRTTGEELYRVRVPFAEVPLSPFLASRLIDSQYTAIVASMSKRGLHNVIDRGEYSAGAFRPRRVVPVSGIAVADNGAVLLRGNDWVGSTVTYAWMRPNGTLRGYLVLPSSQTVMAVRGDNIWSLQESPDGLLRLIHQTVAGPS